MYLYKYLFYLKTCKKKKLSQINIKQKGKDKVSK